MSKGRPTTRTVINDSDLKATDNAFHQIAGGSEKKAKARLTVAARAIPLGEDSGDDLDGFND